MKLTPTDIEKLRNVLAACKVIGVDALVINEGMARGARLPSLDAAIITDLDLSISPDIQMGIGKVVELEKRLAIFGSNVEMEGKTNDNGDVTLLTLSAGKTKMQFRCTSSKLVRYPKSNDDQPVATILMTRAEIAQVSRAVKTLCAETIVLQVSRNGIARLECTDSANDKFEIELSAAAKYEDEVQSLVQTYLAGLFVDVIDAAAKESEEIDFVVGEVGSMTAKVKQHTVMIMPQITGED
jgi:hypothetical protein